jgi:hypothetical protein
MSGRLERRYRRLLAWYPAEHRRVYGDEMLGVMLAGARAGQRHPGWSETVDVLAAAMWMRTRRLLPGARDARWSDAFAVLGTLAPMLLFVVAAHYPVGRSAWQLRLPEPHVQVWPSLNAWLFALAPLAIAVTALLRWRLLAAATAWAAVLGEVVLLGARYHTDPVRVLSLLWTLVLFVTIAGAMSVRGAAGRVRAVLGRRRIVLFAAACALLALSSAVEPFTTRIVQVAGAVRQVDAWPGGTYLSPSFPGGSVGVPTLALYLLAVALILVALARIAGPIRRRLLALLAPVVVLVAVVTLFFQGYEASSARFSSPVLLVPAQWAILVAVPVITFLAAVAAVHRRERTLHLMELGQAAQRRLVSPLADDHGAGGDTAGDVAGDREI